MTNPTISELFTAISADLKTKFGISSENDLKRVLTALAMSNAGMLKLFYLAISDVRKNIWPDLADPESMGGALERFGRIKLGRDPYPATQGEYKIEVSGTIGATILINTEFKSGSESTNPNQLFYAKETTILTATTQEISIIAANVGTDSLLSVDDILFTVNPIININAKATVTEIVTIPTDAEDIEDYRELVLQSYRLEPNGGSASDYVFWSLDVAGVRTVYPFSLPGAAVIYAEATESASTDGYGTCPQVLLNELWTVDKTGVFELDPDSTQSIYNRGRRPLGLTEITLKSVNVKPVVVTITNLKNSTQSVKDSIFAKLKEMLYTKRPYVAGVGNINDRNDTIYLSDFITAIQNAVETGNTYDNITVEVDTMSLPYKCVEGNIPYLYSIVYE